MGKEQISIHAARMGCDKLKSSFILKVQDFNPRSPNGLRQITLCRKGIHGNFNPRSPNGLRPASANFKIHCSAFQSTQPEWAATLCYGIFRDKQMISIHAARMGCDN